MIPAEIIKAKRNGSSISKTELKMFIEGYTKGDISDAQMSALFTSVEKQMNEISSRLPISKRE